jgi:hypothetical protein
LPDDPVWPVAAVPKKESDIRKGLLSCLRSRIMNDLIAVHDLLDQLKEAGFEPGDTINSDEVAEVVRLLSYPPKDKDRAVEQAGVPASDAGTQSCPGGELPQHLVNEIEAALRELDGEPPEARG